MMYLPAEWHPQAFVQLTWPHEGTDWAPLLDEVVQCYVQMAKEIARREPLLIVAKEISAVAEQLRTGHVNMQNICFFQCDTNDTWARDHGFISCIDEEKRILMDFQFNGWGMKFAANLDNQINRQLAEAKAIEGIYTPQLDFVLEGGSIESDGQGTLLTTSSCLLASNRNDLMDRDGIERKLCRLFHTERVLWLDHSWLSGDDTDGHIDTVARFCDAETIAYVQCTDTTDEHYPALSAMESELRQFTTMAGKPYRLVPLPMPSAIYDETDVDAGGKPQRLPATYANFLIINNAVLMPTYRQPENDATAMKQLSSAFPDREIVGIDCSVLIRQHGSLHCCTMQYPTIE
ncbi:MAG: agmatine deiminase family protein [Bacteroidaceae bacterium]|nr:agmatine deiminase family protein [Bacteroidaceae bacterium]